MKRVYICHTYYHEYVAFLREMNLGREHFGEATLILSTMSNDFGDMKTRVEESGVFKDVYFFDEKEDVTSKEVMKYHQDKGNIISNLLQRIKYTKMLGKLQESYVPVDLGAYDDVYLFCDSDPIGYYLNYKKIKYHALEDACNTGIIDNQAMLANLGAWPVKKILAKLGLIFIECGYSRYCIDYIVNDISKNFNPPKNIVECPFDSLYDKISKEDHDILAKVFLPDAEEVKRMLEEKAVDRPCVMLLTEPLCSLDIRKQMFTDLIEKYQKEYTVIIKPHPRDELDYVKEFPDSIVIRGRFPMEVFNDINGLVVEKLISVITQVDTIRFAKSIEYLGMDFLDIYEDPAIHRKQENLENSYKK